MSSMHEHEFRTVLTRRIIDRYLPPSGRLINELALPQHGARVDVAVVADRLTGFEIKTSRDRLSRLPAQQNAYGLVFDRMYLAVEPRHLVGATSIVPTWWGILELSQGPQGHRWVQRRASRLNPGVHLHSLVQLLWRDEVLNELSRLGLADGLRGAPKATLWAELAGACPKVISRTELKQRVRQTLMLREGWRAD